MLPLILAVFGLLFLLRFVVVLRSIRRGNFPRRHGSTSVLVVAGSGGHTMEIIQLLEGLGQHYNPRHYVLASSDQMSEEKLYQFELQRQQSGQNNQNYSLHKIPRSREVRQSYLTSIWTTAVACLYSLPLIFWLRPRLVLCNGPGTCIPLCAAAFLSRLLGWQECAIVYVESLCRVDTLSLSGKLLYPIADALLVQWPQLQKKYPRSMYLGRLV